MAVTNRICGIVEERAKFFTAQGGIDWDDAKTIKQLAQAAGQDEIESQINCGDGTKDLHLCEPIMSG